MKFLKSLSFILSFIGFGLLQAQDFKFIPKEQRLLTDEEVKTTEIIITPDILLFNETGKILPMSQVQLMTNSNYKPLFYVDQNERLKSILFIRLEGVNKTIQKNPEAEFTKGEKALDFITTDLNGNTFKLSDLKGQVVVLNFWFTKCGPCISEMPELNNLTENFKNKKVKFLAITFNSKEIVKQFLKDTAFDYTITPNANDVITMYGVQSYPTSIVIDKNGNIVTKEVGYRTNIKSVLTKAIDAAL
ncbi:TlpA family protein disulfide reductase [Olleya sp. YSTF-M6]|uniref:TlpA family protein disulfide reductase n=1 Tax=Olleya sediminilitoris TaxID=2795739 RepID=A0ABS1WIT9_9FLAO|nr:TlpA disulfide reductase family protein [Olleya sediminilitoris]MBL7559031.1 TlpA family protein disulfide reductase [Olleya sediminilitoris]